MGIVNVIRRLREEFTALPGLRLTEAQVERLCAADASSVAPALLALVSAGFLQKMEDGSFGRAELASDVAEEPTVALHTHHKPSLERFLEHELS
jgi:hypothetical protein